MTAQVNIKNTTNKGFTLIELMVVIAIIAVLAVVGFSIFSNAQKSARDSRRISDIDTLAKSIESARDVTALTPSYTYTQAGGFTNDYPNNKPVDPTGTTVYCIGWSTTAPVANPTGTALSGWTTATCPTGLNSSSVTSAGVVTDMTAQKYWTICAKLEVPGTTAFCKSSLVR